ncbi:electron transfer flavoprotein, alpha subunit [Mycobacterium tuberculosis RGTB423]|nr:electron transfer flavoprotein, alpha subunit [Mycobacterium tuberculosis RGTB423]
MAEVLVLVEHAEGALKKVSAELITAARALGEPAAVVVGVPGTAAPLVDGLKAAGAAKIYVAESDLVDKYLITPAVDVLAGLAESSAPAGVLIAATADGKEIAGRLAARIGSGLLVDVVDVREGGVGVHSIFGGAFTVEAQANGDTPVITVRAGAVEAEPAAGAGEQVSVEVPAAAENAARITAREPAVAGDRPELTEATIVVAGGRGVGSGGELQRGRGAGRLAGRRGRGLACRSRLRLLPGPVPGRPDRQDGVAPALHCPGHLRGDPAPRWHADVQDHRRGQQGRRGADL